MYSIYLNSPMLSFLQYLVSTKIVALNPCPGKPVKHFYLHPNYNISAKVKEGVKEFYDYDVALIQLEEPVDISILAR